MAERDARSISEYTNEREKQINEKFVRGKQTSKDEMNNERINQSFQVQNYRDYNVYSDVENVLNLNPVSYIDEVKSLQNVEADKKTCDVKKNKERTTKSLITNIERIQPLSVSAIVNTAAHIIGPTLTSKPASPVKRLPRRDDSDRNYFESVALNEEVNVLFGDNKEKILVR